MRYFGSKASTVETVLSLALNKRNVRTAADAFGGLGTIGGALRRHRIDVTTCDVLSMPHAFQYSRVVCSAVPSYRSVCRVLNIGSRNELLNYLRQRRNPRSWIVKEFSKNRMFFTFENAAQIAGVWDEIKNWNENGLLTTGERSHLVASLIESVDLCANTAGTYYAHLKHWDRKALRPFDMKFLPVASGLPRGHALKGDALESLSGRKFDLLYLDPPYNSRDYARYYHLPESLAQLKRPRTSKDSIAGLPETIGPESAQIRKAKTIEYLAQLLERVQWRRTVVQYSSNGHIPLPQLRSCLTAHGSVSEHQVEALSYTTMSRRRQSHHHVFIVDR